MGLPQIAIEGHQQKETSTETFFTFEQTATSFVTTKIGWSGSSRREIFFGRPMMENSQSGQIPRQCVAAIHGDSVVLTTEMEKKTLVAIKTMTNDGSAIKVVLQLLMPEAKVQVVRWLLHTDGDVTGVLADIAGSDDD